MDESKLKQLLSDVKTGSITEEDALSRLRTLPVEDLGFARIDHHRQLRIGFPEVIFCAGKEVEDACQIAEKILEKSDKLLMTRASPELARAVLSRIPDAVHEERARCICVDRGEKLAAGTIAILSAGTSDIPVAEEARVTAAMLGAHVEHRYDVGVAGLHRLLGELDSLRDASAIVVVAGMDGALASVVGGLVGRPVIGVPTSIGYGASFGGMAALLAMLNSCAPGVSVVNIDNGFGAGYLAAMISKGVR